MKTLKKLLPILKSIPDGSIIVSNSVLKEIQKELHRIKNIPEGDLPAFLEPSQAESSDKDIYKLLDETIIFENKKYVVDKFTGKIKSEVDLERDHVQSKESLGVRAEKELNKITTIVEFKGFIKKNQHIGGQTRFAKRIQNMFNINKPSEVSKEWKAFQKSKDNFLKDYKNYLIGKEGNLWFLVSGLNRSKRHYDFFSWFAAEVTKDVINLLPNEKLDTSSKQEYCTKINNAIASQMKSYDEIDGIFNNLYEGFDKAEFIKKFNESLNKSNKVLAFKDYLSFLGTQNFTMNLDNLILIMENGYAYEGFEKIINKESAQLFVEVRNEKLELGLSLQRWFFKNQILKFRVSRDLAFKNLLIDKYIDCIFLRLNELSSDKEKLILLNSLNRYLYSISESIQNIDLFFEDDKLIKYFEEVGKADAISQLSSAEEITESVGKLALKAVASFTPKKKVEKND